MGRYSICFVLALFLAGAGADAQNTSVAPVAPDTVLSAIHLGATLVFDVQNITDADDGQNTTTEFRMADSANVYAAGSSIVFRNVSGPVGLLALSDCLTPLVADTPYNPVSNLFRFCYVTSANLSVVAQNERYTYYVRDVNATQSNDAAIDTRVLDPLQPCTLTVNATVQEAACTSAGLEGESVHVFLNGKDWQVDPSNLTYRVTSLPSHGTLILNNVVVTSVPATVYSTSTLVYVPDDEYFNRVGESTLVNGHGESLGGPDTFTFTLVRVSPSSLIGQTVGTYSLYIESVLSTTFRIVSLATQEMRPNSVVTFNSSVLGLADDDREVYPMGLYVFTSKGYLTIPNVATRNVTVEDACTSFCASFQVWGYPRELVSILNAFQVSFPSSVRLTVGTTAAALTEGMDKIKFELFKPAPNGMTADNAYDTFRGLPDKVTYVTWVYAENALQTNDIASTINFLDYLDEIAGVLLTISAFAAIFLYVLFVRLCVAPIVNCCEGRGKCGCLCRKCCCGCFLCCGRCCARMLKFFTCYRCIGPKVKVEDEQMAKMKVAPTPTSKENLKGVRNRRVYQQINGEMDP